MFLEKTIQRNPALIDTAVALHQSGIIPPNTYLIDLDTVADNARLLVKTAAQHGLQLYGMTKQLGRNPLAAHVMVAAGINRAVAVDFDGARLLHAVGIPLGNIGHLTQIPQQMIPAALRMSPEVITLFSVEKAQRVGRVAQQLGVVQPVLLRIADDETAFYPAQEGGFSLAKLVAAAHQISQIKGIRLAGVTSFPCLKFSYEQKRVVATANLTAVLRAAELLRPIFGDGAVAQINAPGVTTSGTMARLLAAGATHGEPGSALAGHTPLHAFYDEPERPAIVYVSEVSHRLDDRIFVYGGGFYPRGRVQAAVVAGEDGVRNGRLPYLVKPSAPKVIDYYGELDGTGRDDCRVGDTAVFAFRSQIFVSRAYVAVVSGIAQGEPQLLGLFNHLGNLLHPESKLPLGQEAALAIINEVVGELEEMPM